MSRTRKKKLKVIAFDIGSDRNAKNPKYLVYKRLSARDKVDFICKHIDIMRPQIDELRAFDPGCRLKIAWQEYGVKGWDSSFNSIETLRFYKARLKNASKEHNIIIDAGTIAVKRPFSGPKALNQLDIAETKTLALLHLIIGEDNAAIRAKHCFANLIRIRDLRRIIDAEIKSARVPGAKLKKSRTVIYAISNTNYVFDKGEIINKNRKKAMFNETFDSIGRFEDRLCFYQPGSEGDSTFEIEGIKLGNETCRDHGEGMLFFTYANLDYQSICSASVKFEPQFFCGRYITQFDSHYRTQLICTDEQPNPDSDFEVELFEYDPFNGRNELRGPLQPFYPLELRICKLLYDAAKTLFIPHRDLFENIQSKFRDLLVPFNPFTAEKKFEEWFDEEFKKLNPSLNNKACKDVREKILGLIRNAQNDPYFQPLNSEEAAPLVSEVAAYHSSDWKLSPAPASPAAAAPPAPVSSIRASGTPATAFAVAAHHSSDLKSSRALASAAAAPAPASTISASRTPATAPALDPPVASLHNLNLPEEPRPIAKIIFYETLIAAYEFLDSLLKDTNRTINAQKSEQQIPKLFEILEKIKIHSFIWKLLENLSLPWLIDCIDHRDFNKLSYVLRQHIILAAIEKNQHELETAFSPHLLDTAIFLMHFQVWKGQAINSAGVVALSPIQRELKKYVKLLNKHLENDKTAFEVLNKRLTNPKIARVYYEVMRSEPYTTTILYRRLDLKPHETKSENSLDARKTEIVTTPPRPIFSKLTLGIAMVGGIASAATGWGVILGALCGGALGKTTEVVSEACRPPRLP